VTPIGLNSLHRSEPDGPMTTNSIGLIGPLLRRGPSFGPMREFAAPPRPNDDPARWSTPRPRCPTPHGSATPARKYRNTAGMRPSALRRSCSERWRSGICAEAGAGDLQRRTGACFGVRLGSRRRRSEAELASNEREAWRRFGGAPGVARAFFYSIGAFSTSGTIEDCLGSGERPARTMTTYIHSSSALPS
jgi:hypothetical protein